MHFDEWIFDSIGLNNMKQVYIKTRVFSGQDSLERLRKFTDKKIWLVCDGFLVDNGTVNLITSKISKSNKVVVCKDVIPDPPLENIAKGVALLKNIQPDVIIAFGGGSAIDTAKGIIYFAPLSGYDKKPKFVAIPTTSGTGSEVTSVTVITDKEMETKHLVVSHDMLPDEVILCPQLTMSVPASITANTGMDVLTHVLEAYVAKNSNAYSDALAEKGVELVFQYLKTCYDRGEDLEARGKMQEASNIAGSAFNIAGLGMNHAIAHQLGGTFHIPHGLANTLILNEVIKKNSEDAYMRSRYATIARKMGFASFQESDEVAVMHLCEKIDECKAEMKMPTRITECKVSAEDVKAKMPEMCENALKDGCVPQARMVYTKADIEKILLSVL